MTPITTCARPSMSIVRPTASAALPNRSLHTPSLRTTTASSFSKSPAENVRPASGRTPTTSKKARIDQPFTHAHRLAAAREDDVADAGAPIGRHCGERLGLAAPVLHVRDGRTFELVLRDPVRAQQRQLVRARIGERPQHHALQHAQHGAGRADADGQDDHDRGSERGFPPQRPQAKPDVAARLVEPLEQRDTLEGAGCSMIGSM